MRAHAHKGDESEMKIVNLTQHKATPEQVSVGVVDIEDQHDAETLMDCLNFREIPTAEEINITAEAIADIGLQGDAAMIGGAPYLMSALEKELINRGIKPIYAFSKRESVEELHPDGSIRKITIFRHLGFVEVV